MKDKIELLKLEKRRYELDENISIIERLKLFFNVPIQKIIGYVEMANVKIDISKKVLIPRYETEELILLTLDLIKKNNYKNILDLCCGSGFIGIALSKNNDQLNVMHSDVDKRAIKQTKINLKINNINNQIIRSNMFQNINSKFDLIVSNPPYIWEEDKHEISKSVLRYEPYSALFAKNKGLEFYEIIENNINKYLNKNGMIVLEINPKNVDWFIKNNYIIVKDINQKDRFAFKKYI